MPQDSLRLKAEALNVPGIDVLKQEQLKEAITNATRPLTVKEQKTVDGFDSKHSGYGAIAEQNIRANHLTGWADIVADTPEEEIK